MNRSSRSSLGAVLTALAVVLAGGVSTAAAHCPPSHHRSAALGCCPAQHDAVKNACLHELECLVLDRQAVRSSRDQIDPPQPSGTATPASEHDLTPPARSALLSLAISPAPPRSSSVSLHLLYAVFLS